MSKLKPYNDRAGYIASLRSGAARGWVVIYEAAEQGLDVEAGRYAISCETHNVFTQTSSLPKARSAMKAVDFCEECVAARVGVAA